MSLKCQHFNVPKPTPVSCQAFISLLLLKLLKCYLLEKRVSLSVLHIASTLSIAVLTEGCSLHVVCFCSVLLCCLNNHFQVALPGRKLISGRLVEEKKTTRQMVRENNTQCFILKIVINFILIL